MPSCSAEGRGCWSCRGELYPCETDVRLCEELETDEEVEVDMESDVLTVLRTGKQYCLKPIGDVNPLSKPPCFLCCSLPNLLWRSSSISLKLVAVSASRYAGL